MGTSIERRRYERVNADFSVRLAKMASETPIPEISTSIARVIDISGSGMLIATDQDVHEGDVVKLLFLKPNTFYFFNGRGKVVRRIPRNDAFAVGVEFVDVPATENKMIDYYLHQ